MGSCQVCRKDSKLSCVCGKASYCGVECQKKDWKDHKPSCPPFVIRESPGKGRGLFATRKIKQGQLILEEYPLITSKNEACLDDFETNVYPNIDEDTKTKILELHDPADNLNRLDAQTAEKLVRISKDPMMEFYKDAETDEMSKIFRIIYGHGIMICGEEDLYNINEGGLYHNFSLINHSCLPNASCSWVMGDFRRTQVRAFKDIEKDEEILINSALGAYYGCGSREFRRQQILENKGFVCECSECSLEGEDLEDNERMRAEIREKDEEINQLKINSEDFLTRKSLKKAMKLYQKRVKLIQKLNIWSEVVFALVQFYHLAVSARLMGITCENDPEIFKQEAWKYAQMFGDNHIHLFNKMVNI